MALPCFTQRIIMDISQVIDLLTELGEYGALLGGIGDALTGAADFAGSVASLS